MVFRQSIISGPTCDAQKGQYSVIQSWTYRSVRSDLVQLFQAWSTNNSIRCVAERDVGMAPGPTYREFYLLLLD